MATKLITVFFISFIVAVHLSTVHSKPVTTEVRLLSQRSGRFIRVTENGDIVANGNQKSFAVFKMYLKNSRIQFELQNKPGMFVMLKELNNPMATDVVNRTSSSTNITVSHEYALVVDYPSESHLTEWEKSGLCGALVMKVDEVTNCFIAFDTSGKVAGPCNSLATNQEDCIGIQIVTTS